MEKLLPIAAMLGMADRDTDGAAGLELISEQTGDFHFAMTIPAEFAKQFAAFPECLRKLVEAELADGSSIVEICGGFPAAPCGDCLKLAKHVGAARRNSEGGIDFYERNNSDYFGEFTDGKRHFFVLEPPRPPEPEPDVNAIREEREARQRAADAALYAVQEAEQTKLRQASRKARKSSTSKLPDEAPSPTMPAANMGTAGRFLESMTGSFERWHDGLGYDLELLKSATPEELVEIENHLVSRPIGDWRDVEALAALDSPRARALLREALKGGNHRIATAVAQYAPNLVSKSERTDTLVAALEGSEIYGGLTQALLQVEEFHPPQVVEALFRCVLTRDGETAVHLAAMLMFVHGKAESSLDWEHRPLFLRFNTEDRAERESAFRELCEKIGVPADPWLRGF